MKGVINKLKLNCVSALTRLTITALDTARLELETRAPRTADTPLPPLRDETPAIAERFMQNMNACFDSLIAERRLAPDVSAYDSEPPNEEALIEAVIAMEGMVKHARNCHVQQSISLTTRLSALSPNLKIDESNNPLDPEQIGESFIEAIRPLNLQAHHLLTIYREFNKAVFHNLENVLIGANAILIDFGVLPELDIQARTRDQQKAKRSRERPTTDRETRAFSAAQPTASPTATGPDPGFFSLLQELITPLTAQAVAASGLPASSAGADVAAPEAATQLIQLQTLLAHVQSELDAQLPAPTPNESSQAVAADIRTAIGSALQEQVAAGRLDVLCPVHARVINLITLLYEAIAHDESQPAAMQALLARTQLPVLRAALADHTFFYDDQHPARLLLNEFAQAGVAWTAAQTLTSDPTWQRVKGLVSRLLESDVVDNTLLKKLVADLRRFLQEQTQANNALERKIRDAADYAERLDDVAQFARQKIRERVLTGSLDPFIDALLDRYIQPFLVKLILKEGPGGSSWKPVMNTIDVLLWSVNPEKQSGDAERFAKINPRLLTNLAKAMEIGGASAFEIEQQTQQLREVQRRSFHANGAEHTSTAGTPDPSITAPDAPQARRETAALPPDDPHVRQVARLPIGVWVEFEGAGGQPVRCTLVARIDSIDKLFFVNQAGVKVAELSRMGLARELKAGTVRIVSEGALVDRALDALIGKLRSIVITR